MNTLKVIVVVLALWVLGLLVLLWRANLENEACRRAFEREVGAMRHAVRIETVVTPRCTPTIKEKP